MKKLFYLLSSALIFLSTGLFCNASSDYGTAFTDVDSNHPYNSSIESLKETGVVEGYSDGTFLPNNTINRAEFLKIAMGRFNIAPSGSDCFSDVKAEWFAGYVCSAHEKGLVDGYKNGTFKPQANISFAEASRIIYNALNASKLEFDTETSDPWYKKYVENLADKNLIPFTITGFDHLLTRGEMAEIIANVGNFYARYDASLSYEDLVSLNKLSAKANFAYRFQKIYGHQLKADGVPDGIDYATFERIMLGTSDCGFNADGNDECQLVESELYRDANRIYNYPPDSYDHKLTILENADAKTFQVHEDIINQFAFDKNSLYTTDNENSFYHKSGDVPDGATYVYKNIFKSGSDVYYLDLVTRAFVKAENIDAATFSVYQSSVDGMFSDKDHLYLYKEPTLVQLNLDKDSFEVLHSGNSSSEYWKIFKDKKGVYYYLSDTGEMKQFTNADGETFEIRYISDSIVANDKNAFYTVNSAGNLTTHSDIDVATYKEINTKGEGFEYVIYYVKDKNKVYSATSLEPVTFVTNVDAFDVYGYSVGNGFDSVSFIYGKNGNDFWVLNSNTGKEKILEGVDFGTFEILGGITFSRHFEKGDIQTESLHYTDPEVCKTLVDEVANNGDGGIKVEILEDKTCLLKISRVIDESSDIAFDSFIAKDSSHVWKYDDTIKGLKELTDVDAESFELEQIGPYAVFKDKNNVYYSKGESLGILDGADPATFGVEEVEELLKEMGLGN